MDFPVYRWIYVPILAYLFVVLFLFAGCVSRDIYPRHVLIDQILVPRANHSDLTNRACMGYEGDKCIKEEVVDYDMDDDETRKRLNQLGFICKIAGKRYKVCMDKPGFCRMSYKKKNWFAKPQRYESFIPITDYQFLIDAKTRCFNKERYNFSDFN
jgi:hypothetical protein